MKHNHKRYVQLIAVVAALVLIGWGLWSRTSSDVVSYDTVQVARDTVVRVVSETGSVQPMERLMLSFPQGGRLVTLYAHEGERVGAGATVAMLDTLHIDQALREAEARVERERMVLAEILAPLREEEAALEDATLEAARTAEASAEGTIRTALAHAYTLLDDALYEEIDELYSGSGDSVRYGITYEYGSTRYMLSAPNALEYDLNSGRVRAEDILVEIGALADSDSGVNEMLTRGESLLREFDAFVTLVASAINRYTSDESADQTVYDAFQTTIASARTSVSTARSELNTAASTYESARAARERAERARDLAYAGADESAVAIQYAALDVATKNVDTVRAQLRDRAIIAPLTGTVTQVLPSVGEVVGPYEPVVELMGDGAYEIEVYVPEADIAGVELGDPVSVTFDAFSDDVAREGEVVRIALSETMREGVPTYKTTVHFTDMAPEDMMLRPGMTADVDIMTDRRENVLLVPTRAIQFDAGRTYVRVLAGGVLVEREVTTGLKGSEGTTEILAGVAEGEEVVLYVEEV